MSRALAAASPAHEGWALLAIAQRDVTKLLRDRTRLAVSLAFPILLIAGLGSVLQQTVRRATGLDAITLLFTGVLAATLFQSAAAGMMSLIEDRESDFTRELFVAPVSRVTIVAGKVLGESVVALCQGAGIVIFAALFGVAMSAGQLLLLLPAGLGACLLGAAFGLATLAALPNQRAALQVFPFLVLPQYFLAGVVVPIQGLPRYLDLVSWLLPMRYAVDLVRAAFYFRLPAYASVVTPGPLVDAAVMAALFVLLLGAGAVLFNHRERTR
ncbi:MAG: ABC transporter permease [Candidatus Dormibacteraeota bacterium]|nr:ABC transporter permease [Candidatus Dormibacteraeota bacterium]